MTERLKLTIRVCHAVRHAHQKGIIQYLAKWAQALSLQCIDSSGAYAFLDTQSLPDIWTTLRTRVAAEVSPEPANLSPAEQYAMNVW